MVNFKNKIRKKKIVGNLKVQSKIYFKSCFKIINKINFINKLVLYSKNCNFA